jgi:hypothetical protein
MNCSIAVLPTAAHGHDGALSCGDKRLMLPVRSLSARQRHSCRPTRARLTWPGRARAQLDAGGMAGRSGDLSSLSTFIRQLFDRSAVA